MPQKVDEGNLTEPNCKGIWTLEDLNVVETPTSRVMSRTVSENTTKLD